ncbi:CopM family metallochaperone [Devosia chinhatensis]|uniref:Signal peptide protein n=1 Tax=Devosia chinhatensis TaxID=429727 RepID=A0A0F5FJG1_9HYPH|nr:DUF305 domain-containing protein [Devosia chinhatensis]KKB08986.1 signal peptide protein [Devosia chinhatensis]
MKHAVPTVLFLALCLPVAAQDHSGHGGHDHAAMMAGSAATQAFKQANMRMHAEMDIDFTGNADVDFIAGMIPHHQGAVDMARIILEHGSDPEVLALAQSIIQSQEAEIAWMKDWLAKNGR